MSLFNVFKKRKKDIEKFILPDFFEITEDDIKEYMFMTTSKSYTSPLELEKNVYMIDKEIKKYKETEKYKILSTELKYFEFKKICVKHVSYIENDIDTILGFKNNNFQRSLYMPSLGISTQFSLFKEDNDIPFGNYIWTFVSSFIEPISIRYEKDKKLELDCKSHYLMEENDNSNQEVTNLGSIKKRNVKSLMDYCKQEDKERKSDYNILSSISNAKIIIQNLYLKNSELIEMENLIKNCNSFEDLVDKLYEKYNLRICTISKINDIYIIKGNDSENIIYTTLPYDEWTNGLKRCNQIKGGKDMKKEDNNMTNILKAAEETLEEVLNSFENEKSQSENVDFESLGYDSYEEYYEHEHFFGKSK